MKAWKSGAPLMLLFAASTSWANTAAFECKSSLGTTVLSMNVLQQSHDFVATLEGATVTGPVLVEHEIASPRDALSVAGVSDILQTVRMTSAEWAKVSKVEIFTYGIFEDDAAGVRGANFLDANGNIVEKGMFFGWAGPLSCG